jgi:hypothetical protein
MIAWPDPVPTIFSVPAYWQKKRRPMPLSSHSTLAKKIAELEKRYDHKFKVVFDAIHELMSPLKVKSKKIGFRPDDHEE